MSIFKTIKNKAEIILTWVGLAGAVGGLFAVYAEFVIVKNDVDRLKDELNQTQELVKEINISEIYYEVKALKQDKMERGKVLDLIIEDLKRTNTRLDQVILMNK
jgi:uncharacterized membrane protein (DUF106 family)